MEASEEASEKKVKPRREETHGTDPSPLFLPFSSSTLPTRQSKNTGRRGEEGERKEEEAEIPSPSPSPNPCPIISQSGDPRADQVRGFGGRSHEREGLRLQGAQRQAQEGPVVDSCSLSFSEFFLDRDRALLLPQLVEGMRGKPFLVVRLIVLS